jgi:hypothetical protein
LREQNRFRPSIEALEDRQLLAFSFPSPIPPPSCIISGEGCPKPPEIEPLPGTAFPAQGPRLSAFRTFRIGADERVDLIAIQVKASSFKRSVLDKLADRAAERNTLNAHAADGQYDRWRVAPGKVLLLIWKNVDSGDIGWAAVQYDKGIGKFRVLYNDNSKATLGNGRSDVGVWSSNGDEITIRILNPRNENGNKTNDIHYSFKLG